MSKQTQAHLSYFVPEPSNLSGRCDELQTSQHVKLSFFQVFSYVSCNVTDLSAAFLTFTFMLVSFCHNPVPFSSPLFHTPVVLDGWPQVFKLNHLHLLHHPHQNTFSTLLLLTFTPFLYTGNPHSSPCRRHIIRKHNIPQSQTSSASLRSSQKQLLKFTFNQSVAPTTHYCLSAPMHILHRSHTSL